MWANTLTLSSGCKVCWSASRNSTVPNSNSSLSTTSKGTSDFYCSGAAVWRSCLLPLFYFSILSVDKLLKLCIEEWKRDIIRSQIPSILGGVGPLNSFVQFCMYTTLCVTGCTISRSLTQIALGIFECSSGGSRSGVAANRAVQEGWQDSEGTAEGRECLLHIYYCRLYRAN